jgi:NTE family protein
LDFDKLKSKLIPDVKLNFWTLLKFGTNRKKVMKEIGASLKENLPKFKSIADNTPLKKKLEKLFDRNEIKGTRFYCGFVSLDKGEYYAVPHEDFTSNEDFINGVLASTAMPIVWEPVPSISFLNERVQCSVDGGIKNVSPLGDLISVISAENDPETEYVVFVINTSCCHTEEEDHEQSNVAKIAVRSLVDIAINEIFNNDLRQFVQVNDILAQLKEQNIDVPLYDFDYLNKKRSKRALQSFKAVIIHPGLKVLGDTLCASKAVIERRIKHGEQRAKQAVKELLEQKENAMALVVD